MGVSLYWRTLGGRKDHPLNVGWRSMAHELLDRNGLLGHINIACSERLREVALQQFKGERDPPFDHAGDIEAAMLELAAALEKHKDIEVCAVW